MNNLRSEPLTNGQRVVHRDGSLALGKLGAWLIVAAAGGLFFAVNGGYSVIGLEFVAKQFNAAGALFWLAISAWKLNVPAAAIAAGVPPQPIIPWLLVFGSSCLQVALVWRKLSGKQIPGWMIALSIITSAYDLGTTYFGLGTAAWMQKAGVVLQLPLAVVFTFGLEGLIGFLLRRR